MRWARSVALICSLIPGTAVFASAQSAAPLPAAALQVTPLSPDQHRELDAWLSAVEAWQRFMAKHANRPARDRLARIVPRPPRPAEPAWLEAHCDAVDAAGPADRPEPMARACALLRDPLPAADAARQQVQAAREEAERPAKHSSLLTRMHLDGAGVTTSSGPRSYGIVGFHMTLVDVGRVQLFGPPGVMLLSVPESDGDRRITLGYTWGVSIRLADLRMSSSTRNMSLFLTMSKVWMNGGAASVTGGSAQIAGLSIAPRKRP